MNKKYCQSYLLIPTLALFLAAIIVCGSTAVIAFQPNALLEKGMTIPSNGMGTLDNNYLIFEGFEVVLAVIEDNAGEGVIDAVIDVIAEFAVAHGLADDLRNRHRSCRH